MGKFIFQEAKDNGLDVIGFSSSDPLETLGGFDVMIDFTTTQATMAHVAFCQKQGKKLIIGTTGFNETQKQQIKQAGKEMAIVFAPNMSIGVNMCFALLKQIATTLGDSAEVEIIEAHHSHKVDSPSGTSLKMGEIIAHALNRDLNEVGVFDRRGMGARDPKSIGFSAIRAKDIVGDHTAMFALDGERIEITHRASNRAIYAKGAVRAAKWLSEQPAGLYSMQDVLGV